MCLMKNWNAGAQTGRLLRKAMSRGYVHMYLNHVMQADKGADFDFLIGEVRQRSPPAKSLEDQIIRAIGL